MTTGSEYHGIVEAPWRRVYELAAVIAWGAASVWLAWLLSAGIFPWLAILALGVAVFFLVFRSLEAWDILRAKRALPGKSVQCVSPEFVRAKVRQQPNALWLGWGFDWTAGQAQMILELERRDVKRNLHRMVPRWLWPRGDGPKKGQGYIHGVSAKERDIYVPYAELAGHTFVPSTTGSMKTRLLSLIALQAILRQPNRTVIVIDPKGDTELLRLIQWACNAAGKPDAFAFLHPAFPRESVRLDLMKNWTTTTESASRVAEMMGGDSSSAPFKAFGWQVINNIVQAMLHVGERPQLTNLRGYIEAGPDHLIHRVICSYIRRLGMNPDTELARYKGQAERTRGRSRATPVETVAAVLYYSKELQPTRPLAAIDGLLSMYNHEAAHFSKMIATLQPILAMLTSDELESLLSPDYNDADDPRELLDNARIIRTGRVLYLGLHSMSDATVSAAIGSLFLADLVAVLGERYVRNETEPGITLLLDEANEVVNQSLVSILNKGRGAGLEAYFFTQTVPDFIAKYGDEAPALQLLGNANNVIFGRLQDAQTIEYVVEKTGETIVRMTQDQYSINPVGGKRDITTYQASYGTRETETREPLVRPELCGEIPDLEYFGIFAGRKVVKGRIPVVTES